MAFGKSCQPNESLLSFESVPVVIRVACLIITIICPGFAVLFFLFDGNKIRFVFVCSWGKKYTIYVLKYQLLHLTNFKILMLKIRLQ